MTECVPDQEGEDPFRVVTDTGSSFGFEFRSGAFQVSCLGFKALGFRVWGLGHPHVGLRVSGKRFGIRVLSLGFWRGGPEPPFVSWVVKSRDLDSRTRHGTLHIIC